MIYPGSCHCGVVKFEVEAPKNIDVEDCNCSICSKSGYLHLIVPASKFRLISGEDALTNYLFNSGVARHRFCKHCGIKPFYTPRSNPDGIDVNVNCLDVKPKSMNINKFDGKNWEANAYKLADKTKKKPDR